MRRSLFATVALLVLAGCGTSPKTHYFTLTPVAPTRAVARTAIEPVSVTRFDIPQQLDRRELVRRTGANHLAVLATARWGAPLGAMAREVLAQDLRNLLPEGSIRSLDATAPSAGVRRLVIVAHRFAPQPDGTTSLDADWTLLSADGGRREMHHHVHFAVQGGAGGNGGDQAAAMSRTLGQLADHIAVALTGASE